MKKIVCPNCFGEQIVIFKNPKTDIELFLCVNLKCLYQGDVAELKQKTILWSILRWISQKFQMKNY